MRRLTVYDVTVILFLLAALFTVGMHLGDDGRENEPLILHVTLDVTLSRGTLLGSEQYLVDGRYEAEIENISATSLSFSIRARCTDAGMAIEGAKYISENQPIKIYSDTSYIEGRAVSIRAEPLG